MIRLGAALVSPLPPHRRSMAPLCALPPTRRNTLRPIPPPSPPGPPRLPTPRFTRILPTSSYHLLLQAPRSSLPHQSPASLKAPEQAYSTSNPAKLVPMAVVMPPLLEELSHGLISLKTFWFQRDKPSCLLQPYRRLEPPKLSRLQSYLPPHPPSPAK